MLNTITVDDIIEQLTQKVLRESKSPAYLSTKAAAEYIGVSVQYLEIARHKGTGPKFSKLSRMVRYRREELDQYMAKHAKTNTCGGK